MSDDPTILASSNGGSGFGPRSLWLIRRLCAAMACGLIALVAVLSMADKQSFQEFLYVYFGRWYIDFSWNIRWGNVWWTGCAVGLFVPAVKLANPVKLILIGGLIGIPVALFTLYAMDEILADLAISRAYAPFEFAELEGSWLDRPPRNSKIWPSEYRFLFSQTIFVGLACGLLFGFALSRPKTRRKQWLIVSFFVAASIAIVAILFLQGEFESWVQRKQAAIRDYLQSVEP